MNTEKWKKCCKKYIKDIWNNSGGSMNIVWFVGECPTCKHFIGLTQTPKQEADNFLKDL